MTNYYSCMETCGMQTSCGNIHCSANPNFVGKRSEKKRYSRKKSRPNNEEHPADFKWGNKYR